SLGRLREPAWSVRCLWHQRRLGPAVPVPHPRPVLLHAPGRRPAGAGPPHRGHDGHHGQPRSDHGWGRQVSVVPQSWSRLSLAGKIILPLIAVFVALNVALVLLWVSGLLPLLVQASLDT